MKKSPNILFYMMLMAFALSCDSFVEVEPSGPTNVTFFKTEKDFQEAKNRHV